METVFQAVLEQGSALWAFLETQARLLTWPSRLWQLGIAVACVLLAWVGRLWAAKRLRSWMHGLEGWPKWQLRVVLILQKRLQLLLLTALLWAATWIMQALFFFPSRSYLLELAATIATAWLLVSLVARLIRNPILRRVVTWALGLWVTFYYLGLVDETTLLLDRTALAVGEFRISALTVLEALAVTGLLFALARFVTRTSSARIRRNEGISPSMQVLSVKLIQIALYTAAVLIGLTAVGVDLSGFAFMSGAIGLGLGFGLQKVVSNLVSGLIILLDKSIKPGDVISLGETFGWISQLGARYVSVVTRDGKEYLIPNEDLITGQVVNWSHSNRLVRLDIYFGTAYRDDPHEVRRISVEAAQAVDRVLTHRPPVCHIVGFGDSSVDYILRFWIEDPTGGLTNIRGNVYLALWDAFQANGISIPFPQREVRMLEGSRLETRPASDACSEAAERVGQD